MTTYAEACETYATDQGLDPITRALAAQGIPATVDQTGGFCMCVRVDLVEGGAHWLWLTLGAEFPAKGEEQQITLRHRRRILGLRDALRRFRTTPGRTDLYDCRVDDLEDP